MLTHIFAYIVRHLHKFHLTCQSKAPGKATIWNLGFHCSSCSALRGSLFLLFCRCCGPRWRTTRVFVVVPEERRREAREEGEWSGRRRGNFFTWRGPKAFVVKRRVYFYGLACSRHKLRVIHMMKHRLASFVVTLNNSIGNASCLDRRWEVYCLWMTSHDFTRQ